MKKPHHKADQKLVIKQTNGSIEIKPRGLNIIGGGDARYWSLPENEAAKLIRVSWLDVSGSVDVEKGKKYRISFEVLLKPNTSGWKDGSPVLVMAKLGKKGEYQYKEVAPNQIVSSKFVKIPQEALEIFVPNNATDVRLFFGLYEVWSREWKEGLQINKALVELIP